jgi:uncharacterized protein
LSVHQRDSYNAKRLLREVEGDEVPVPCFGAVLDENQFLRVAARLKQAGWSFVIPPYKRFRDKAREQWVLVVRDPSGNAVELKSFTKMPAGTWA